MSTCSLRMGHAALWETDMANYKIVVTKNGRRYFTTSEGDLDSFGWAFNMYWDFKRMFNSPQYDIRLFSGEPVTEMKWAKVEMEAVCTTKSM